MNVSNLDPHALGVLLVAPFVGSFLATLAVRLPANEQAVFGRSHCRACGHVLGWADLVPIASWITHRGRCRYCGRRIGKFYPLVELGAIALAAWAATLMEGWLLWASCGLGWALLTLAIIDHRHYLLPDGITLPLIGAGLITAYALDPALLAGHATGAVAGFAVFAALRWLYRQLRGQEGLGLGDAKLAAAAGAWTSWSGLPSVVLWACVGAFAVTLIGSTRGAKVTLQTRIAFGIYLCAGLWLVWLYGPFDFTF